MMKRRLPGNCLLNKHEINYYLDTMCDVTTISKKVANQIAAQLIANNKTKCKTDDGSIK